MQSAYDQLIDALDDMDADALLVLLDGCDDDLYWWLDDAFPDADLADDMASMLAWLQLRCQLPRKFAACMADFFRSDCALYDRTLCALGIQDDQ